MVLVIALLVPSRPLIRSHEANALVVDVVPSRPLPPPPAERSPSPTPQAQSAPKPSPSPSAPLVTESAPSDGAASPPHIWTFDPSQGVTVVVYGQRPTLDLPAADRPAAEISGYRAGFEPSEIEGLNGPHAGGSVLFDVLVDESGMASAVVPVERNCSERAFETALAVVSQWRYAPATFAGTPVQGWLQVRIDF
ncbi:hypothetical protein GCM10008101_26230 [Lysobacter xinjiangensis]|uniref:TonB C-terminal domain-containing protein n=1 Tax=Cognatilysobacter xinjiangensis TaxID=546892 RepID=A0ABQ3C712_9GAMM|nr:hypothetical protein GCM10008101_26230 [Lysobacter xinjiangensis]